jgi:uncharacterized membrane protein YqjE
MPEAAGPAGSQEGGLLDSLKALTRTLLALGQTRLEIVGSDIEERLALFQRDILLAVVAAFCLGVALLFTALFFVFLAPLEYRPHVIGLFALLFFIASGALFAALRAAHRDRPRTFSTAIQELGKDRDSLQ